MGGAEYAAAARFYREVVLTYEGDDCLFWPHAKSGNGQAMLDNPDGSRVVAHALCEAAHGPAPSPKHEAAHNCGNGHLACVAKRHIRWATHKENMADQLIHGTRNRGSRNGQVKLRREDIPVIRSMLGTISYRKIGRMFGVNQGTIQALAAGRTWTWV